jgi:alkylation response protein AidB-like acyl-CoA dehydrogenase
MDFNLVELTPEQEAFRAEVQAYLAEIVTEDVLQEEREGGDGVNIGVHLALGAKGWLTPSWPVEEGGAGLDKVSQRILDDEINRSDLPRISIGVTSLVWGAVEKHGDRELVAELKPKIADGTVRCCLGYTEPDGGSDIAAAKVKAVKDGDEWVLNGSKIFTTCAHRSQYTFLITRTDPDLPKHKGITMFLVPLDSPGVEIQGIKTFSGERTNIVYYGDVHISDRYRIGGVNDGWSVLHGPLDEEHSIGGESDGLDDMSVGQSFLHVLEPALDAALDWAVNTERADGSRPIEDPSVLARLGEVALGLEVGTCTPGPMGRVKGSLALVTGSAQLLDLVGSASLLHHGAEGAVGEGAIDFAHRFAQGSATYGGTIEVFRTIIAQHVLGLPKLSYPGARTFLQSRRPERSAALAS